MFFVTQKQTLVKTLPQTTTVKASKATVVTYSDTREVRESPHLDSAISWRSGKALVNWWELYTPDAASVTRAHADQWQISRIPHLCHSSHILVNHSQQWVSISFLQRNVTTANKQQPVIIATDWQCQSFTSYNNNNDRLTASDPGQPG